MDADSFLEELELVSAAQKPGNAVRHAERNITSRRSQSPIIDKSNYEREKFEALLKIQQTKLTSSPVVSTSSPIMNLNIQLRKPIEEITSPISSVSKVFIPSPNDQRSHKIDLKDKNISKNNSSNNNSHNEVKKSSCHKSAKHSSKSRHLEKGKKSKSSDDKLKPLDNIDRLEVPSKSIVSSKERTKKRSGSRESCRLSDGSSKENTGPTDSSGDGPSDGTNKLWQRISTETLKNKNELADGNNSLMLLTAIKDIISSYTKAESAKLMNMMQELYINSQSSMIKQLILTSDELKETLPVRDSAKVQSLMAENEQLKNNIVFLRNRLEEFQKNAESMDKLRQENLALKKKIWEFGK